MSQYLLKMEGITKEFPGVKALDDVNLQVKHAEIHALVGENGAGKSTLMNILSGTFPHGTYKGEITLNDKPVSFRDIKHSEKAGIAIIHQELALSPYLSVSENIFLGNEKANFNIIDWNYTHIEAEKIMKKLGLEINSNMSVNKLGVGQQQMVEIAKALAKNAKLLILDEPTAALNDNDSEKLLSLLIDLKDHGITSILISHHLNEVIAVADQITILRDGKVVENLEAKNQEVSESSIIKAMVGRELQDRFPTRSHEIGDEIFEVKNWTVYHPEQETRLIIDDINLHVNKGEVVGIAGLMGSGRTELAKSIFGSYYGSHISGEVVLDKQTIDTSTIPKTIEQGIVYLTEDRKEEGLVLIEDIRENTVMTGLNKISHYNVLNKNKEILVANKYVSMLDIKTPSIFQRVENLSGGNQQKVVLSKLIFSDPKLLILDEPTRGIDVGAKFEIYSIINDLAKQGKACLFISSELEEIIGFCDRVYVMNQGRIVGEFDKNNVSQEKIMKCIIDSQNK